MDYRIYAIGIMIVFGLIGYYYSSDIVDSLIELTVESKTVHAYYDSKYLYNLVTGTVSKQDDGYLLTDNTGELFFYVDSGFNCNSELSGTVTLLIYSKQESVLSFIPIHKNYARRIIGGC